MMFGRLKIVLIASHPNTRHLDAVCLARGGPATDYHANRGKRSADVMSNVSCHAEMCRNDSFGDQPFVHSDRLCEWVKSSGKFSAGADDSILEVPPHSLPRCQQAALLRRRHLSRILQARCFLLYFRENLPDPPYSLQMALFECWTHSATSTKCQPLQPSVRSSFENVSCGAHVGAPCINQFHSCTILLFRDLLLCTI